MTTDLPRPALPLSDIDPVVSVVLRAGPLEATLDRGTLRWIRLGGREVVRGIYAAIRDPDWGTVAPVFPRYQVAKGDDGFLVSFRAEHVRADGIDFAWDGEIIGTPDGRLRFTFAGSARSSFQVGRIGFCVLHPRELAGARLDIETQWGLLRGHFPELVAGSSPFGAIRAIRQRPGASDEIHIAFEGDLFEMEDQRNWTDASFKTFCRPLSLPVPYLVEVGERVSQAIEIAPRRAANSAALGTSRSATSVRFGDEPLGPLPSIGFIAAPPTVRIPREALARLRGLAPAHIRGTIDLAGDAEADLCALVSSSVPLGAPLEVELVARADGAGTETIIERLALSRVPIARILVFDHASHVTARALASRVRAACAAVGLDVPIGGGTRANFWNLNTTAVPADLIDIVSFRLCPQVHAFDAASILETPTTHADLVRTARSIAPGRSIAVGPITLGQIINPDRIGDPPPTPAGHLPERYDARQPTMLAATWALGTISALASVQVASMTICETAGWGGLIAADHQGGPPLPVPAGTPYPVLLLLQSVLEWRSAAVLPVVAPPGISALGLIRADGGIRVFVANMAMAPRRVRIQLPGDGSWGAAQLGEHPARWSSAGRATATADVDLGPGGIARLDLEPT